MAYVLKCTWLSGQMSPSLEKKMQVQNQPLLLTFLSTALTRSNLNPLAFTLLFQSKQCLLEVALKQHMLPTNVGTLEANLTLRLWNRCCEKKRLYRLLEIWLNSAAQKMPSILTQSLNKLIYREKSKSSITSQPFKISCHVTATCRECKWKTNELLMKILTKNWVQSGEKVALSWKKKHSWVQIVTFRKLGLLTWIWKTSRIVIFCRDVQKTPQM